MRSLSGLPRCAFCKVISPESITYGTCRRCRELGMGVAESRVDLELAAYRRLGEVMIEDRSLVDLMRGLRLAIAGEPIRG
jgi:hypothetical protein